MSMRWDFSAPTTALGDGSVPLAEGRLDLPDVSLSIVVENISKRETLIIGLIPVPTGADDVSQQPPPFEVELRLERTSTAATTLDSRLVLLQTDDGRRFAPSGHRRAGKVTSLPRPSKPLLYYSKLEAEQRRPGHQWACHYEAESDTSPIVTLDGRTCVKLSFAMAPIQPSRSFMLLIQGLQKEGRPVTVPSIRLAKTSLVGAEYYCMWFILCGP